MPDVEKKKKKKGGHLTKFLTVQAGIRAFIVDNAPAHQQEMANAWASGLTGVGNLLGYLSGYLELPKILPFFGDTQFKVLCAIASISLSSTLIISCSYIKERDPRFEGPPRSKKRLGVIGFFKRVFKSIRHLPPQVAKVCKVQIAAWIGWFPFLYYSTTYFGQVYVNPIFEENPNLPSEKIDEIWAAATRKGTLALFINAIVSFSTNTILPLLVEPTYKHETKSEQENSSSAAAVAADEHNNGERTQRRSLSPSRAQWEQWEPSSAPLLTNEEGEVVGSSLKNTWLSKVRIPGFTLRRAWFLSYLLFSACMFSTFFVYSTKGATTVIALIGIPWALTLWAPFAFISAEIAKTNAQNRTLRTQSETAAGGPDGGGGSSQAAAGEAAVDDVERGQRKAVEEEDDDEDESLTQAGIVLGLHNMAVSFPQILSSLVSGVIFKIFQKPRGKPWDDSVGWVLRFAGCAGLLAAWLTKRLSEEHIRT